MDSELISNSKISDIVIIQSPQKYPKKKIIFYSNGNKFF